MKTGDIKQVVMLGVVAVLAIGFLVVRVLPKQTVLLPLLGGQRTVAPGAGSASNVLLPLGLVGNPFSHPKLGIPAVPVAGATKPPSDIDKRGGFAPIQPGELPAPEDPNGTGSPEESAGSTRQQEQDPQIAVKAVLRVDQPVALLAVGSEKAEMFKVGDELAEGIRLLSIGNSEITLSVFGKERRLQVGESLRNPEK